MTRSTHLAAARFISMLVALASILPAQAAEPIRIGLSLALTGGVAAAGKQVLLAMQIWRDDINAKGGLLGRPVELVYYDDQSSPTMVPAIYTKLIEVDKVDLTVGPYATNMVAPAIPVLAQHNMTTVGITAVDANHDFRYPRYFAMIPTGPNPRIAFSEGWFDVAMEQNPKPATIALTAADAEFAQNSVDGARENAKKAGLKIVYDKSYPPTTTDFTPVIRAVQATSPDIVYNASYPPDTVGMIRAANEVGLTTKIFGGNMVGLLSTVFKLQLGPLLNGIVNEGDASLPAKGFNFPGLADILAKYEAQAAGQGIDPLGYTYAPLGYAAMQVLAAGVEGTSSLDQDKIAKYLHGHSVNTVEGEISFTAIGEWSKGRSIVTQYQHVTSHDLDQFKDYKTQVVLWPPDHKDGTMIYPYADARKQPPLRRDR